MKSYVEMLEQQMEVSQQFSQANFGLKIGDDFPEIVREILGSKKVSSLLLIHALMIGIFGKQISESMREPGVEVDMGKAILKNLDVFESPLALFYWGIQIGRQLEAENAPLDHTSRDF